jgi:hypothetical protein
MFSKATFMPNRHINLFVLFVFLFPFFSLLFPLSLSVDYCLSSPSLTISKLLIVVCLFTVNCQQDESGVRESGPRFFVKFTIIPENLR